MAADSQRRSSRWPAILLSILGLLLAAQTVRMRLAQKAVRDEAPALAIAARPQNGWGAAQEAERLFLGAQVPQSVAMAKHALNQTPYAVTAVRVLAQSYQTSRQALAAEQSWQTASALGWRDKPTQAWAVIRALSNSEPAIFAMRADALLRSAGDNRAMTRFVRQAMNVPEIRPDFVNRLASNPPWRLPFFDVDQLLAGTELEGTRQALLGLRLTQAPPSRRELFDTIRSLVLERRFAEAAQLDRTFVRRTPDQGSLLDDGGFENSSLDYVRNVTPFDWMIDEGGASLDRTGGKRTVVVSTEAVKSQTVLSRYLSLAAGNYSLGFQLQRTTQAPSSITAKVICASSGAALATSEGHPASAQSWTATAVRFDVPPSCGLVQIAIAPVPAEDGGDVMVDNFSLKKN